MYDESRFRTEYQWRKKGIKKASILLYESILGKQGGTCRLCPQRPGRRRLVLDYNLDTGKIRGLLCQSCNLIVGQIDALRGNKEKLDRITAYIMSDGEPQVSDAEADILHIDTTCLNPAIYYRQDLAIKRYTELLLENPNMGREKAIKLVAEEMGKCTRTIRRYFGLP